jgi:hypothetical protein
MLEGWFKTKKLFATSNIISASVHPLGKFLATDLVKTHLNFTFPHENLEIPLKSPLKKL